MKRFIIPLLFIFFLASTPAWAVNRALMIDNATKKNVTGVSVFNINGLELFQAGFTAKAGEFLAISPDGKGVTSYPVTSSVTGSGGVNAGALGSIAYYGTNPTGATIYPLDQLANAVLASDSGASPAYTVTLPNAVQTNITKLGVLSQGLSGTSGVFTAGVTTGPLAAKGQGTTSDTTGFVVEDSAGVSAFVVKDDGTAHMRAGVTFFFSSNAGIFTNSGGSVFLFDNFGNSVDLGDLKN